MGWCRTLALFDRSAWSVSGDTPPRRALGLLPPAELGDARQRQVELEALDQFTAGGWPRACADTTGRLVRLRAHIANRPFTLASGSLWPTLPSSAWRRLRRLETLLPSAGARIALQADLDGIGFLLAERHTVVVYNAPEPVRAWHTQSALPGLSVASALPDGPFDLVVVGLADPATNEEVLTAAVPKLAASGVLAAQIRAPWDRTVAAQLEGYGLEVCSQLRDVDVAWVAPNHVVDGGDLWCARRRVSPFPERSRVGGSDIFEYPYHVLQFDRLAPRRVSDLEATDNWLEGLVDRAPEPCHPPLVRRGKGGHISVVLRGHSGRGIQCLWRPVAGYAAMTVVAPTPSWLWAVLSGVFQHWGSPNSVVRPHRTRTWMGAPVHV